ncbi:MAG: PIN domain-containing protein [Actinomycetota bacterium]|nr:PIN domain-containing protein [Actinomycetota bacterium]
MILFVETNFVLELAFGQEEHASCRALVNLAEGNDALSLALPAYCVGEAYGRQIRRQREREALQRRLAAELGELSRSPTHARRLEEVGEVMSLLAESAEEERQRLESVLGELYATATLIPLDESVAREAHRQQRRRGLGPQDALVYASVLNHLRRSGGGGLPAGSESCFVTRDNDFADEDVRADLEGLGCRLLFRFRDALGYVRSRLP